MTDCPATCRDTAGLPRGGGKGPLPVVRAGKGERRGEKTTSSTLKEQKAARTQLAVPLGVVISQGEHERHKIGVHQQARIGELWCMERVVTAKEGGGKRGPQVIVNNVQGG